MKPGIDEAIDLLHAATVGVLASHTTALPGYPYASILPFALDQESHPLFLISGLAEHTQNLLADPRASFLVWDAGGGSVLTSARLTLVGKAQPFPADPLLAERYLRYQPDAKRYLQLGDFRFFRLQAERLRYIAGFGRMGWIEGQRLDAAASIALTEEAALIERLQARLQPPQELLGVDPWGADLRQGPLRRRLQFLRRPVAAADIEQAFVLATEHADEG
jgi:putative heme iron utilization protein